MTKKTNKKKKSENLVSALCAMPSQLINTYLWILFYVTFTNGSSILNANKYIPAKDNKIRIAVIGAGIGGSSFVHYFNKLNNGYGSMIDIYEKNDYIGGRTKSIMIDDEIVELGASIAIKDNQYIYNLVNELSLTHQFVKQKGKVGKTVIWDKHNKQFSFISYDSDSWLNMPYTLYHFGPKKLFDLFISSRSFVAKLEKIYQYQNASQTASNAKQFYDIMDVYSLSQINCLEYLYKQLYGIEENNDIMIKEKLSKLRILNELVTGITRVNYNQNFYDMHALVCMTSISAIGSGGSDAIWNVKEGNQQLSKRMIQNAIESNKVDKINNIKLKLSRKVTSIIKMDPKSMYKYKISYQDISHHDVDREINVGNKYYDIIIIAAPLSLMDCKFIGFDERFYNNLDIGMKVKYEIVYATLVKGLLNQSYFQSSNNKIKETEFNSINDLLVGNYYNENEERIFNSISRKKVLRNDSYLYKIFSTKSIKDRNKLSEIFAFYDNDNVIEEEWRAYPKYSSKAVFPEILMDNSDDNDKEGIYYINAVEIGASAMEILAISAKNIALLINRKLVQLKNKFDDEKKNEDHDEL